MAKMSPSNGATKEKTVGSLSTQITLQFDALIRDYCKVNDVERSDIIRNGVALVLRNGGVDVPENIVQMERKRGTGPRMGKRKVLAAKATAADQMMAMLEASGQHDLLAQFKAFMEAAAVPA